MPSEKSMEEAKKSLNIAFDSTCRTDGLITVSMNGLIEAFAEALDRREAETIERCAKTAESCPLERSTTLAEEITPYIRKQIAKQIRSTGNEK